MTTSAKQVERAAFDRRVHAVLHCNLNAAHLQRTADFYLSLGLRERMRSVSKDSDCRPLGLGEHTASITCFHYDERGPRAAPAIELVNWLSPEVEPRRSLDAVPRGYHSVGLRASQPAELLPDVSATADVVVRGRRVTALLTADPEGVPVEMVQVDPTGSLSEPAGAKFSHIRLVSSDLERTAAWWAQVGFEPIPDGPEGSLSLVVPEDPTFSIEFSLDPNAVIPPWRANTQGLYRIALAVDDVQRAHSSLVECGAEMPEPVFIPMPDTPTGGFTVLFMVDPDGAVVELVSRPRAAVNRPSEPTGAPV